MEKDIEQVLEEYLKTPLTPEDKGRFYTELIEVYMDTSNNINREYSSKLKEISQTLEDIQGISS